MRKAIVYGNGESRIGHYLYGEFPNDEYVTWGCNAIYRDIDVMNLVSVDYGMQLEIYERFMSLDMPMHINVGLVIGT